MKFKVGMKIRIVPVKNVGISSLASKMWRGYVATIVKLRKNPNSARLGYAVVRVRDKSSIVNISINIDEMQMCESEANYIVYNAKNLPEIV